MSINKNTVTLKILSNVTCEEQVFDKLIKVKRMDTEEIGYLLCSHCCQWPKDLVSQATWLEGCHTPKKFRGDSRLLLGYHPDEYTSWEWDIQKNNLVLTVDEKEITDNLIQIDFWEQHSLLMEWGEKRRKKLFEKIWQKAMLDRDEKNGVLAYFRMIDGIWSKLKSYEKHEAYRIFYEETEVIEIDYDTLTYEFVREEEEYNYRLDKYLDGIKVIEEDIDNGYAFAQKVYDYWEWSKTLEVLINGGPWAIAIDLEEREEEIKKQEEEEEKEKEKEEEEEEEKEEEEEEEKEEERKIFKIIKKVLFYKLF